MAPVVLSQLGRRHTAVVAEAVPEVDVIDVLHDDPPDRADVIVNAPWGRDALPDLLASGAGWVHTMSTGVDRLDLSLFAGRTLTCDRGSNAVAIAEWVIAQILAAEKRLPEMWVTEPPEHWNLADLGSLEDGRVGLLGFGTIGRAVARRLLPFGTEVRALRRSGRPAEVDGVTVVDDPAGLAAWAQHLVVALPLTPETHQVVDADLLAHAGPGLHLVNVARGAHVDQDALRAALDDGRVGLASLDVVDPEPLPAGHWLYEHPSVHVSAHVSWSAPDGWERSVTAFVDNLRRWVAGEPLEGVVDLDAGY